MKNLLKGTLLATTLFMGSSAIAQQAISLPRPNMKAKSLTVTEALSTRHSVRQFDTTPLTLQQLSDLCWAACGESRNNDYRTAPSARNKKEIRLFVFTEKGVYEYDAVANSLTQKADGDHRELITGSANGYKQAFAKEAPVTLLMVIDFNLIGTKNERTIMMGCVDAGNVSENINLYCQSVGLATVPRATHDTDGIHKLLALTDNQLPIINNPVGWPKK